MDPKFRNKTVAQTKNKTKSFQNKYLREIMKIFWPHTITNYELLERTNSKIIEKSPREGRWRFTGHVLLMESSEKSRVVQGTRKSTTWSP